MPLEAMRPVGRAILDSDDGGGCGIEVQSRVLDLAFARATNSREHRAD